MGGQAAPLAMTTLRERMLIRRLQQRDERAFAEVVRLYQHKVFNLVYRMVGSREEAEDVAQEVFVTVFKPSTPSAATPSSRRGSIASRPTTRATA